MNVYHNSQQKLYRTPFGAVELGDEITLRIAVQEQKVCPRVILRLWVNDVEQKRYMYRVGKSNGLVFFEIKIRAIDTPGLMWYYFIIEERKRTYYYCNNSEFLGGEGEVFEKPADSFQITVYEKGQQVPSWLREGIMYQIYVDRFYKPGETIKKDREYFYHENWGDTPRFDLTDRYGEYSNRDFFGGNLYGVIEKLPYLSELGVTSLYLNPIFDAFSNHKYDTGDYEKVDEMFGGNQAFDELCKKAEQYDIKIVLDGVFNHTGSDSKYFNKEENYDNLGAYQSLDSPYYPWYRFSKYPDDYDSWWGIDTLPAVNEHDPSYFDYIINDEQSIVRRWIKAGAFGWRLDVVDELPDFFVKAICKAVKEENPEAIVIGEVWEDASNKKSYGEMREYLLGKELDSVMNYPVKKAVIAFFQEQMSSKELSRIIMSIFENYPKEIFYSLMNILGTHDVPRIITVLGGAPDSDKLSLEQRASFRLNERQREQGKRKLMLASLVQFTLPGFPCIYYGDEVGLEGLKDPFNRRCFPWEEQDDEILEWYKYLGLLRSERSVLKNGCFKIFPTSKSVFAFMRHNHNGIDCFGNQTEEDYIVVIVNASSSSFEYVSLNCSDFGITSLVSLYADFGVSDHAGCFDLTLPPLGYYILQGIR